MDIEEKFDNAIESMAKNNFSLAAEITKLGYPRLTTNVPTAGVSWNQKKKQINFEFNKDFIKTLSDEEFMFVCAHEAMHIINSHVLTIAREAKKRKADKGDLREFLMRYNIASDCVVNDSLVYLYKVPKMLERIGAVYGKPTIGIDCHNLSAMEVYRLLPESKKLEGKEGKIDVHEWDSFFDKDGNINKDFLDKIDGVLENNQDNSSLSDKELAQIDKIVEEIKKEVPNHQAGNRKVGERRSITKDSRNISNWDKLLFDFIDSNLVEDKWNRPNRKMSQFYPDSILPRTDEKETHDIFIAIDSSGSISYEALSLFVEVVRNTPKRFKMKAISFDTDCYEYDFRSDEKPKGGGGTNFDIIEKYILKNFKKYPNVIVLTDGHGTSVNPKHKAKWLFLLYGSSTDMFCKDIRHHKLEEFLK